MSKVEKSGGESAMGSATSGAVPSGSGHIGNGNPLQASSRWPLRVRLAMVASEEIEQLVELLAAGGAA